MTLEEKVVLAQNGDDNAFYSLISEKKENLYITAYTYVKNKEDALDIVQDTVYKAYKGIKKLKEPSFFNTWLTRILINSSLDHIKKNKKLIYVKDVEAKQVIKEDNKEEKIDLYNAITSLSEKYKSIIILKYFQNLTIVEISELLEAPIGTIKTNLHKALKELRIELREEEIV